MVAHFQLVQHDDVRFLELFLRGVFVSHHYLAFLREHTVCSTRAGLWYPAAMLQTEIDILNAKLLIKMYGQNRWRRRRQQRWWSRVWLSPERCLEFGLYDQLMIELRIEDQRSFVCRRRISTWMKAFWFDMLIICALSVICPVRAHFAYSQSPFYPLFKPKLFVLSGVHPFLVRCLSCTCSIVVRSLSFFMRLILWELEFRFFRPDNNGYNSTLIFIIRSQSVSAIRCCVSKP